MEKEKYLSLNSEELYQHLSADILANASGGKQLADELTATERYREDYMFRAHVETAKAMALTIQGENTEVLFLSLDLEERCKALEMWDLVAINQNMIANVYFVFGIWEQALKYYQAVIRTEAEHDLLLVTSVAYNNIALIYHVLGANEKTYEYINLAIDSLEKGGETQPYYESKMVLYLSDLVVVLCQMERLDEAIDALARIENIRIENMTEDALNAYYSSQMCYAFYISDYEAARAASAMLKSAIPETKFERRADMLYEYITLCEKFDLDYEFYIEDLLEIEKMYYEGSAVLNTALCSSLRSYYQSIGDEENYERLTKLYVELLEKEIGEVRRRQLDSLLVVENIIKSSEDLAEDAAKKTEFELIAKEAVRNRDVLQETYHRLEIINQLGKQLTASLDLDTVIDLIYQKLKENLPIDNFILMVAEPEQRQLRSVVNYVGGRLRSPFRLDIDNPNSVFAECYRTNQMIFSNDVSKEPRFQNRNLLHIGKGTKPESVVFIPLLVENRLIGMASIQSRGAQVYEEKHLQFLEEIRPYLSIALNNAIRSWTLENEIQGHILTQEKLQEANRKLDLLSSLDGLTQISNRRDFEKKILDLLQEAKKNHQDVAVFMFDIDDFKIYNDTYGHFEGDEVLKKVAHIVRENMDSIGGLSARFGGEEFIGACLGLDLEESRSLADKIRKDVYDLFLKNEKARLGRLTISVGGASAKSPDTGKRADLLRQADMALYEAKNGGKNLTVIRKLETEESKRLW